MEPRIGYTRSDVVPSQEQVFEDIYNRVQAECGVEGVVSLVRYLTQTALEQREQTLKNLEIEAKEAKRAIDLINEVMSNRPMAKSPY